MNRHGWRVAALIAIMAALVAVPAGRAEEAPLAEPPRYGPPSAPSNVRAEVTYEGLLVTWRRGPVSRPRPTHVIVDAGPGSCPVIAPADRRWVILPITEGQTEVTPRVRWVNDLGVSAPQSAAGTYVVDHLASARYRPVQILSLTDLHGRIERTRHTIGAAHLATAFARDRDAVATTVAVSSGDNFGKSPLISALFEERPTIEALNMMGLDVSTFGNHEHDRPLSHVREFVEASDFPWTVANYSDLAPVSGATKAVEPYVLLERAGLTIGIVGMNLAQTARIVPRANLTYGNGQRLEIWARTTEVAQAAQDARDAGADVVILVVHEGWSRNVGARAMGPLISIAQRVSKYVDAIYGGHTHREFTSLRGNTLVAQTTANGQMYGRSHLCVDLEERRVIGAVHENITRKMLRQIEPDADVAAVVADYAERRDLMLNEPIGRVAEEVRHGGDPSLERSGESPLGNFLADVLRREYRTDFALVNAGTFRDSLPASKFRPADPLLQRPGSYDGGPFDITLGDLTKAFRSSKNAVTTTITGTKLWRAMERALEDYPRNPHFMQVSGLRVEFDPDRPVGERIVGLWDARGYAIAPNDRVYTVATLGYIVHGNFGRGAIFDRPGTVVHRPYLDSVIDAVQLDTRLGRSVTFPPPDGRLRNVAMLTESD